MLVGGRASEGLKPFCEVVDHQEGVDVRFELGVRAVMVALNGCLLQRSVHPLNLTIGPRMVWVVSLCSRDCQYFCVRPVIGHEFTNAR